MATRTQRIGGRSRFVLLLAAVSLCFLPVAAQAQLKCHAKVDRKSGAVLISASGFAGTLQWELSNSAVAREFANASDCIAAAVAKNCLLDPVQPHVAPSDCVVTVNSGGDKCSARIKGCDPGARKLPSDGISLLSDGSARYGLVWKRAELVTARDDLRTYPRALRARARVNGGSSAAPGIRSGLRAGIYDWRIPNIFELRDFAGSIRSGLRASPSLATPLEAVWPVGDLWWSRTDDTNQGGLARWGIRRAGPGQFSLRSRARTLTAHTALRWKVRTPAIRGLPLTTRVAEPYCCEAVAGACVVWGPPCP
ncbi:MAG: hypothetical protein HY899_01405 [Deltaproteobacteria bacterium]|nr:hypothetical protein [Deltaproteobacteria bacterium]